MELQEKRRQERAGSLSLYRTSRVVQLKLAPRKQGPLGPGSLAGPREPYWPHSRIEQSRESQAWLLGNWGKLYEPYRLLRAVHSVCGSC